MALLYRRRRGGGCTGTSESGHILALNLCRLRVCVYCIPNELRVGVFLYKLIPGSGVRLFCCTSTPNLCVRVFTSMSVPNPCVHVFTHKTAPNPRVRVFTHKNTPDLRISVLTYRITPKLRVRVFTYVWTLNLCVFLLPWVLNAGIIAKRHVPSSAIQFECASRSDTFKPAGQHDLKSQDPIHTP